MTKTNSTTNKELTFEQQDYIEKLLSEFSQEMITPCLSSKWLDDLSWMPRTYGLPCVKESLSCNPERIIDDWTCLWLDEWNDMMEKLKAPSDRISFEEWCFEGNFEAKTEFLTQLVDNEFGKELVSIFTNYICHIDSEYDSDYLTELNSIIKSGITPIYSDTKVSITNDDTYVAFFAPLTGCIYRNELGYDVDIESYYKFCTRLKKYSSKIDFTLLECDEIEIYDPDDFEYYCQMYWEFNVCDEIKEICDGNFENWFYSGETTELSYAYLKEYFDLLLFECLNKLNTILGLSATLKSLPDYDPVIDVNDESDDKNDDIGDDDYDDACSGGYDSYEDDDDEDQDDQYIIIYNTYIFQLFAHRKGAAYYMRAPFSAQPSTLTTLTIYLIVQLSILYSIFNYVITKSEERRYHKCIRKVITTFLQTKKRRILK